MKDSPDMHLSLENVTERVIYPNPEATIYTFALEFYWQSISPKCVESLFHINKRYKGIFLFNEPIQDVLYDSDKRLIGSSVNVKTI